MRLIERDQYLRKLFAVRDIPDIKVITGIRRSGKSKLMDAYIEKLSPEPNLNIIRIKLTLKQFEALLDADALYQYVEERYEQGKKNYLFIDEVQLCNGFERIINSFYEEEMFDIYLTGSNAFLPSSDLATLFGGRVCEIHVYPFSFSEYLLYYPSSDIQASFDGYVKNGGMSGSYLYRTEATARGYISSIYRTTIAKDIITKFHIENEALLLMLGNYLMDTVGERTSIRNIANKVSSSSYKTNDKTIGCYLSLLCKAFMFYPVKRYDIKGKRYLETEQKYYLADLSFRYAEIGTKMPDYGHLYENLVAIELMRRGFEIYVGQLYQKEVDFVAIKNGMKYYIQVSDDITRKETFVREVSPLLSIKDAYPKLVIARTKHMETQYEGVKVLDLASWLLDKESL